MNIPNQSIHFGKKSIRSWRCEDLRKSAVKKGCLGIHVNGLREKGYILHLTFICKTRNKLMCIVHICQIGPHNT